MLQGGRDACPRLRGPASCILKPGRSLSFSSVQQLRQQADKCDEFESAFRIIVNKAVCARIPKPGHCAGKHHHEALLLVAVGLIGEIVELEDRIAWANALSIKVVPSTSSEALRRTNPLSAFTAASTALA